MIICPVEEGTGKSVVIRSMQEEDLQEVVAIEEDLFSDSWSLEGFKSTLRQPDTNFLVAVDAGLGVVGYCGSYRALDEAEIVNVAVRRDCQNHGLGGKLVEQLVAEEAAAGICSFILEVRVGNLAAQHLYEKIGFRSIGIRRRFYDNPVEDAVIMQMGNITDDK